MDSRGTAYYSTPQFAEYLADKTRWEASHAAYCEHVNPLTYNALVISEHRMKIALRICRETPEHLAAFGW